MKPNEITENMELISSFRNGTVGGGSSFLAAVLTMDITSWAEPLLLGVIATLLTTTISFFWKRLLHNKFDSEEKDKE